MGVHREVLSPRTHSRRARVELALALGAGATTAVTASAASLGTITDGKLSAGVAGVTACDTDGVTTTYTTSYDPTAPAGYVVDTVTIGSISALCDAKTVYVTLADTAGAKLASGQQLFSTTVGATSVTLTTWTPAKARAERVESIAVSIA